VGLFKGTIEEISGFNELKKDVIDKARDAIEEFCN